MAPPIVTAGLISGAASLLGGIGSSVLSSSAYDRQIEAQKQENEKNRKFNAEQAELARQYNTQMVNDARQYDLPANVMSRLKSAGINPALAYSNGQPITSVGVGSTTQQAAGSTGSVGASLPDFSGIANAGLSASQSINQLAEASHSNALAGLTESELMWYDRMAQSKIDVNNSIIFNNNASGELSLQKKVESAKMCDQIAKNIEGIDQQIRESQSRINLNDVDAALKDIDLLTRGIMNEAQVKNMMKDLDLKDAEIKSLLGTLYINRLLADDTISLHDKERSVLQNTSATLFQRFQANLPASEKNAIDMNVKTGEFYINNAYGLAAMQGGAQLLNTGLNIGAQFITRGRGPKSIRGFGM